MPKQFARRVFPPLRLNVEESDRVMNRTSMSSQEEALREALLRCPDFSKDRDSLADQVRDTIRDRERDIMRDRVRDERRDRERDEPIDANRMKREQNRDRIRDIERDKDRDKERDEKRDLKRDKERDKVRDSNRDLIRDKAFLDNLSKDRDNQRDQVRDAVRDTRRDVIRDEKRDKERDIERDKERDIERDLERDRVRDSQRDEKRDKRRDIERDRERDKLRDNDRDKKRDSQRDVERDLKRDLERDMLRDKLRDDKRDATRDHARDSQRDGKRDEIRDSTRDKERDNIRDSGRDEYRDEKRDARRDDKRDTGRDLRRDLERDHKRDQERDKERDRTRDESRDAGRDLNRDIERDLFRDKSQTSTSTFRSAPNRIDYVSGRSEAGEISISTQVLPPMSDVPQEGHAPTGGLSHVTTDPMSPKQAKEQYCVSCKAKYFLDDRPVHATEQKDSTEIRALLVRSVGQQVKELHRRLILLLAEIQRILKVKQVALLTLKDETSGVSVDPRTVLKADLMMINAFIKLMENNNGMTRLKIAATLERFGVAVKLEQLGAKKREMTKSAAFSLSPQAEAYMDRLQKQLKDRADRLSSLREKIAKEQNLLSKEFIMPANPMEYYQAYTVPANNATELMSPQCQPMPIQGSPRKIDIRQSPSPAVMADAPSPSRPSPLVAPIPSIAERNAMNRRLAAEQQQRQEAKGDESRRRIGSTARRVLERLRSVSHGVKRDPGPESDTHRQTLPPPFVGAVLNKKTHMTIENRQWHGLDFLNSRLEGVGVRKNSK